MFLTPELVVRGSSVPHFLFYRRLWVVVVLGWVLLFPSYSSMSARAVGEPFSLSWVNDSQTDGSVRHGVTWPAVRYRSYVLERSSSLEALSWEVVGSGYGSVAGQVLSSWVGWSPAAGSTAGGQAAAAVGPARRWVQVDVWWRGAAVGSASAVYARWTGSDGVSYV
jgi:hypothetical protein